MLAFFPNREYYNRKRIRLAAEPTVRKSRLDARSFSPVFASLFAFRKRRNVVAEPKRRAVEAAFVSEATRAEKTAAKRCGTAKMIK